jgi:hypothetical protein
MDIKEERAKHIEAIETSRNKKMYDSDLQYLDEVIVIQGREEYMQFINQMKKDILGSNTYTGSNTDFLDKKPKWCLLQTQCEQWQILTDKFNFSHTTMLSRNEIKYWHHISKQCRRNTKNILRTVQQIKQEEWRNSKLYYMRIGKYGNIARMNNPKMRSGPIAGKFYPSKPGETPRRAINDEERKEASLATHEQWMDNPPGGKNCHFLDIISDEVGPHGIKIEPNKTFDDLAEWQYLEGMLHDKVNSETAERIRAAHNKLPKLFQQIKTDTKIIYPFKYDCTTGEFLYSKLEFDLRKNITCGHGKARATGFAIPVLGRLPKIFIDTYIIKCKIQLTLRLLDIGTECSLRICIGKPCGGVRPLTVSHDDNVFLNGLAQQAIQREIARLKILPQNIVSYQKGKGCADATIVDNIVKEIATTGEWFLGRNC